MILNTTSKAGESSLISSGFNSNGWQKLFLKKKLHTSHEISLLKICAFCLLHYKHEKIKVHQAPKSFFFA